MVAVERQRAATTVVCDIGLRVGKRQCDAGDVGMGWEDSRQHGQRASAERLRHVVGTGDPVIQATFSCVIIISV